MRLGVRKTTQVWKGVPDHCSDVKRNDLSFNVNGHSELNPVLCSFSLLWKTNQSILLPSLHFLKFVTKQGPSHSILSPYQHAQLTASFIFLPQGLIYLLPRGWEMTAFWVGYLIFHYSLILYHNFSPWSHFSTSPQDLQYFFIIVRPGDSGSLFLFIFYLLCSVSFYNLKKWNLWPDSIIIITFYSAITMSCIP